MVRAQPRSGYGESHGTGHGEGHGTARDRAGTSRGVRTDAGEAAARDAAEVHVKSERILRQVEPHVPVVTPAKLPVVLHQVDARLLRMGNAGNGTSQLSVAEGGTR